MRERKGSEGALTPAKAALRVHGVCVCVCVQDERERERSEGARTPAKAALRVHGQVVQVANLYQIDR